jgi:hypothetical protein
VWRQREKKKGAPILIYKQGRPLQQQQQEQEQQHHHHSLKAADNPPSTCLYPRCIVDWLASCHFVSYPLFLFYFSLVASPFNSALSTFGK